jgi:hypothetical protein
MRSSGGRRSRSTTCAPDGRGVPEWFDERAIGFSAEQRKAMAAFLHWCRERLAEQWAEAAPPDDVDKALAYWRD